MIDSDPNNTTSDSSLAGTGSSSNEISGAQGAGFRHFFTGPIIKTELLVEWLDQHGIQATAAWQDPNLPDDGDLSREVRVMVSAADYDRAWHLFFAEREDEL